MGELWEYIIDNSLYFVSRRDLHFGGGDKLGDQIRVYPRQYIIEGMTLKVSDK